MINNPNAAINAGNRKANILPGFTSEKSSIPITNEIKTIIFSLVLFRTVKIKTHKNTVIIFTEGFHFSNIKL